MKRQRRRLGRRIALLAAAAGLIVVPLSSGGGFVGRNGRIVAVTNTGAVVAVTSSTSDTLAAAASATNGSGASLSPDRSKVVYTTPGGQVHVHCLDGSCDVNLGAGSEPSWSPDGSTIAYVDTATGDVFTIGVNSDGTANGSAHDQTPSVGTAEDPAWSSSGAKIAFANVRGTHTEIWTVDYSTASPPSGSLTQVTSNSGTDEDRQPTWSPSGSTLVFQSNRAGGAGTDQLYSTDAAGGGAITQLTNDASVDTDPVYSPDGTEIAFSRSDGVYEMPSAGGTATQVAALTSPETADWEVLIPTNTTQPSLNAQSNPVVGQTISANHGTWSGVDTSLSSAYQYEFLRCATDGSGCTPIGGFSTSSSYTLSSADAGYTIGVYVEASNKAGTSAPVGDAVPTNPVLGSGPTNVSPPTITLGTFGTTTLTAPMVGGYVSGTVGTWTGTGNVYTYQWKKCDVKTGFCFTIAGATTSTYLVTSDVYGWQLRLDVTATNDSGATTAFSATTAAVTAIAPVNTVSPPITGSNQVGATLTVGTGTWTGSVPLTFSYQWKRCNPQGDLASCVAIAGATSPTYVLTASDQGVALRAYVTATNVAGSVTAFTNHTLPTLPANVVPPPPAVSPKPTNTTPPVVNGTTSPGNVLEATRGTWTGKSPIRYRYAWQRCDALGGGCRAVPNTRKATYKVMEADLGSTLRVAVTAVNSAGKKTAVSSVTDTISLTKPLPKGRHIVGSAKADYLAGGGGNDTIQGLGGNDTILGGAGDDRLFGGAGNDVIDGGPGKDTISGGPGNDTVYAADGERDVIDCGPGRDHAIVDAIDVVKNCELVTLSNPTAAKP